MQLPPLAALLLLGITAGSLLGARADTRVHLEGGVRPVALLVELALLRGLFNQPGDEVGTFSLDASAPELDFRVEPGTLVITTPTGTLAAQGGAPAVLYGVLPRDSESGRPLKAEAPLGASCPTGAEVDCWVEGDSIPADLEVADALGAFLAEPAPPLYPTPSIAAGPQSAAAFATLLATLPWNALMTVFAAPRDGQPQTAQQCSLVTPQYCSSLGFLLFVTSLLGDDPNAPPTVRYLWQAGALYDVTDATGDLAAYAGGTVHVLGLERARGGVATYGVPLVLFPAGATLDPATPFAVAPPIAPEAPSFGLAYATVPEPSTTALGGAVVAILTALRLRLARWASVQR